MAFFSSFCLALLTEAKLLSLVSISSLKALDTVSLLSLFLELSFDFLSFSFSSPFSLFLALCSASFRLSKSPIAGVNFVEKLDFKFSPFLKLDEGFDVFDEGFDVIDLGGGESVSYLRYCSISPSEGTNELVFSHSTQNFDGVDLKIVGLEAGAEVAFQVVGYNGVVSPKDVSLGIYKFKVDAVTKRTLAK